MLMPAGSGDLYEKRKGVYPKAVDGFYRRLKWAIMAVTLIVYWGTPWLRWDRGPYAPDQAVLIDLAHRRFYMFAIEIWPHEFYYVAGLLIMAGIGLFLLTSAVGRAWCGYACPQTVWTDLFQHVERFIDGDRNAQIRLSHAPWTAAKLARRMAKWTIWLAIAFATGGAWIFYFADAPTLQHQYWTGTAAPVAYATTALLTATTLLLGGFMREQVCIYMCPWPRIQTAMLDEKSLVVTYKEWRGEKRGSVKKAQANPDQFGDCIDCNQCVAVCPTGIDIRDGLQMACIGCAACIDACDGVMDKMGYARGLIGYKSEHSLQGGTTHWLRPRLLGYAAALVVMIGALVVALQLRPMVSLDVIKDRGLFRENALGQIENIYLLKVINKTERTQHYLLRLLDADGFTLQGDTALVIPAGEMSELPVSVAMLAERPTSSSQTLSFVISERDDPAIRSVAHSRFVAPMNR